MLLDILDACLCKIGFEEGKEEDEPERPCRYKEEEEEETFADLNPMLRPPGDREGSDESDEREFRDVLERRREPCIATFEAIVSNLVLGDLVDSSSAFPSSATYYALELWAAPAKRRTHQLGYVT